MSNTNKKTYKYSEIFRSFQGEAHYTGISSAWIRFFKCNLSCSGFGQKDPTDPSTYILPYQDFDVNSVTKVEDLPVFEFGCDSSYSWSAKFKHLMHNETASTICDQLQDVLKHRTNPYGNFVHPTTRQPTHMCFTGGEPMLSQDAMGAILEEFFRRGNIPSHVTVETNGTRPFKPKDSLDQFIKKNYDHNGQREWFWSCSPKLWSTSGEKESRAINPDVVASYAAMSNCGQLKYVVNGTQQSWDEVEEHTAAFREVGIEWPVWIMGVGATKESQEQGGGIVAEIAMEAIKRGYNFSGRLHCHVFSNVIGT